MLSQSNKLGRFTKQSGDNGSGARVKCVGKLGQICSGIVIGSSSAGFISEGQRLVAAW